MIYHSTSMDARGRLHARTRSERIKPRLLLWAYSPALRFKLGENQAWWAAQDQVGQPRIAREWSRPPATTVLGRARMIDTPTREAG